MPAYCDHDKIVECCSTCCRLCWLADQLDARLEEDRAHPFYGHGWPTYHRLVEKPSTLRRTRASQTS
jgi:hypothetical protein